MKFLVLAALLVVVAAAPNKLQETKPVAIVKSESEFNDDGSYTWGFESEDGVKVDQSGSQKQVDPKDPESIGTVMRGSYSYTAPDGKVYTVTWVADENGYQPSAAHLPVAPAV